MKSDLKIYAIQSDTNKLYTALNRIGNGINIIYRNVDSKLVLGNKQIDKRKFSTYIYNEESNIAIVIMKGCKISSTEIIDYLDKKHKKYVEVNFVPIKEKTKIIDNMPELFFINDLYSLEQLIIKSKKNNNNYCTIYSSCSGNLKLGYLDKYYEYSEINKIDIKEMIKFNDKIILLTNNNIDYIDVLKNNSINFYFSYNREPNIIKSKRLIK